MIRNKSDKTIKLKIDHSHKLQICFFNYSYTVAGREFQRFCRRGPAKIETNLSTNAVMSFENDYKSIFNSHKPKITGNIKFHITFLKEIENNKYEYIESNTIEFELVE